MRIFITGAQGVGKSTLVRELHKALPDLSVFDSVSKDFMRTKQDQFDPEFQLRISLKCLDIYVNERNFISSRSYFDSLAYPQLNEVMDDNARDTILNMVKLYEPLVFQEDCLYIYLPIEFELSSDGNALRDTDRVYQKQVDYTIRDLIYNSHHKDRIYSISGDVESRAKQVLNIVKYRSKLCKLVY